ncbi:hypothetical protein BASA60_008772 [Batrachochytrium salamandrivorans]|nr:hypothetical protein BASA60_008772 [Batrachochytrium salamandrivorans]
MSLARWLRFLWRQRVEPLSALGFRQILCASCVLLWSLRLGFFLYKRVLKVEDKRFDKFKITPLAFIIPFFIQAVWIFVTALPVWVILSNPCSTQTVWDWPDILGGILWVMGFAIEIIADETKASFKKSHPHDFVTTGIWAYSRYANYFGEITLWVGMFIMCISGFTQTWQWVTIISPIFVFCLIVFVSGIPILEASSQRRYGDRADYQIYVARTSTLFPWPPRKAAIASSSVSDRTIQIISQ